MAGRRAKAIAPGALNAALRHAKRHSNPVRNRAIILLSIKAGLRAGEIAKLEWSMVLDANRRVANSIDVNDRIAKRGAGRTIPLHPDLRQALAKLLEQSSGDGSVIRSRKGGAMQPNSIVNWFATLYRDLGLEGCSSHSGRRTFITRLARATHKAGGSLRDVQILAGHRSIETTQSYIEGDTNVQRRLVSLI